MAKKEEEKKPAKPYELMGKILAPPPAKKKVEETPSREQKPA